MAEKMQASLLTEDDKLFLSNLQSWMRSSMEFSILGIQPKDSDLVRIDGKLSPSLALKLGQKSAFVSLGELRQLSEDSAQNGMIYEAWMDSALQNAYIFSKPLQTEDAFRFIAYFKAYHEIDNEQALAAGAREALDRARQELYGH
jgi:hypothetical protein